MEKYLVQTEKAEVKNWINTVLAAYMKKHGENQSNFEHIIDFLNSDKAPTRLRKMSYKQAHAGAEQWVKTLRKKGADIVETETDVETFLDYGNGVKLVKLVGQNAFKREGFMMSHCVASYYGKKDVAVYSLRDVNNNPHCTIEVQTANQNINQIKGKGNGSIHPKYIKYILKALKKLGKDVRGSELQHLGYLELEPYMWQYLEAKFTGLKTITFKNQRYLYKYSKLEGTK